MAQDSTMVKLFEKLNDLKSIFVFGQKIIPVIQSLIDFMRDTVPLLEKINQSIADSTHKIPKAKHHISDVTHATELATTEILDLVDSISDDLQNIEQELHGLNQSHNQTNTEINEIVKLVEDNPRAVERLKLLKENINGNDVITESINKISKIRNDAYNITISLQVQDITSQQLAAVNHLIESVQDKLSSLISNLDESELHKLEISNSALYSDDIVFDPHASYSKETAKQEMADSLINAGHNATQEEIDKLFS